MNFINNLNSLSENEFVSIFGSVFEKSEWIANEAYKFKPFKDAEDLMNKIGDNITVSGYDGKVVRIDFRFTVIRNNNESDTDNYSEIMIPNSLMLKTIISVYKYKK